MRLYLRLADESGSMPRSSQQRGCGAQPYVGAPYSSTTEVGRGGQAWPQLMPGLPGTELALEAGGNQTHVARGGQFTGFTSRCLPGTSSHGYLCVVTSKRKSHGLNFWPRLYYWYSNAMVQEAGSEGTIRSNCVTTRQQLTQVSVVFTSRMEQIPLSSFFFCSGKKLLSTASPMCLGLRALAYWAHKLNHNVSVLFFPYRPILCSFCAGSHRTHPRRGKLAGRSDFTKTRLWGNYLGPG